MRKLFNKRYWLLHLVEYAAVIGFLIAGSLNFFAALFLYSHLSLYVFSWTTSFKLKTHSLFFNWLVVFIKYFIRITFFCVFGLLTVIVVDAPSPADLDEIISGIYVMIGFWGALPFLLSLGISLYVVLSNRAHRS